MEQDLGLSASFVVTMRKGCLSSPRSVCCTACRECLNGSFLFDVKPSLSNSSTLTSCGRQEAVCWLFNGRNFEEAETDEQEAEPDEALKRTKKKRGQKKTHDESEPAFCVSMSIHVNVRQIQGDDHIEYACRHEQQLVELSPKHFCASSCAPPRSQCQRQPFPVHSWQQHQPQ